MKRLIAFIIVVSSLLGVEKINAQVGVSVNIGIAPPALPVYAQPPCPVEGYLWTPGYWAYGPYGYYWVPGVWVRPARIGWLWTPGYWGFEGGYYLWHAGYWGPHVGFYGGVCYGYGYGGTGFYGGRWEGGAFRYNSAVWHVGPGFHNTYVDRTVIRESANRASFNGTGGVMARPSAEERAAMNEQHIQPTAEQQSHEHSASMSRNQRASINHGNPTTTARSSVGGARYNSAGSAMHSASHANTGAQHSAAPSRGGAQPQHRAAQPQRNNVQRAPQRQPQGGRGGQGRYNGGGGGQGRRFR